jgi:hypothetical protein
MKESILLSFLQPVRRIGSNIDIKINLLIIIILVFSFSLLLSDP